MAAYPPQLLNPEDPESIAQYTRDLSAFLQGNISIGEPIATNPATQGVDALRPNGVKGHMLGSFVRTEWTANNQQQNLVHNLNVEPKGLTLPIPAGTLWTDPLNVGWVIVRCLGETLVGGGAGGAMFDWHSGFDITANYIELECHISGHVVNANNHFITDTWFFPTTR